MAMWHDVIELQPKARKASVFLRRIKLVPRHSVGIEAMCQFSDIGMNNGNSAVSAAVTVALKNGNSDSGRDISVGIAEFL